jgi:hypothetical protein
VKSSLFNHFKNSYVRKSFIINGSINKFIVAKIIKIIGMLIFNLNDTIKNTEEITMAKAFKILQALII